MNRIIFKKEGRAKFISHLDLIRTMQRAFIRAGVGIKHTEGFNPHPYMNFALPLSVGVESVCELMDFELEGDIELSDVPAALNKKFPEGITVLDAYNSDIKFKEIAFLKVAGRLVYDAGAAEDYAYKLRNLFTDKELVVEKKTKRGMIQCNVSAGIREIEITAGDGEVSLIATLSVQAPIATPALLIEAVKVYQPESLPDFASFTRLEVFDINMNLFR